MLSRSAHRLLFLFFSALVAFALPLNEVGVSVGLIGLVVNWAFEWRYRKFFHSFQGARPLLFFLGIYGLVIVGLIFTADFSWALHDLRIKLPLLLVPIVFFSSDRLQEKELHLILLALIGGVFVASVASMLVFWQVIPIELSSSRSISLFISHIRFALLICMAVAALVYLMRERYRTLPTILKVLGGLLVVWFVMFTFILQSITGMVIMVLLFTGFMVGRIRAISNPMYRLWAYSFFGAVILIGASLITKTISSYYTVEIVDPAIDTYTTANGRAYSKGLSSQERENGHYVDLFVCEEELEREWNRRGNLRYNEVGKDGFLVQYALKRFLTSKGLQKDSIGVWSLSKDEVCAIEKGVANVLDMSPFSIKGKIYRLVREVDLYNRGVDVGGASLAQRFVYWKLAAQIISENWLVGVGTGDVKEAYKQKYIENPSLLEPKFQLRAHNQYITMFVTYGIFGGVFFLIALFYPIIALRAWKEPLVLAFAIILMLSMLNEDTLETHIGVSFAAFFYSVLFFGWLRERTFVRINEKDASR